MGNVAAFRIAIRAEGPVVNAYLALPDTMEKARLIGSIDRRMLELGDDRAAFDKWIEVLQLLATNFCREVLHVTPDHYDIHRAPEHERAGNG